MIYLLSGKETNSIRIVLLEPTDVQLPLPDLDAEMLHEAKLLQPRLRTLLISDSSECYGSYSVEAFLPNGCSNADIVDRAAVLCERKRVPHKKPSESASQLVSKPRRAA